MISNTQSSSTLAKQGGMAKGISSFTKSELAFQYSPNVPQSTALNRLSRWIKGDSQLYQSLLAAGYHDRQRLLSRRQVEIIYEYLGEPE